MLAATVEQEHSTVLARSVPLPRPAVGSASRVQLGGSELVLEHARGSFSLLWSNGREARRYVLGLGERGELIAELRSPRLPVQLRLRETLTLVPGSRLSGYVTVPLVPTIVFRDGAHSMPLLELHPPNLRGQWSEDAGHSYQCGASWLVRFPFPTDEVRAVVPVRLRNQSDRPVSPPHLEVSFGDSDLHAMRRSLVVRPQRFVYGSDEVLPKEGA